MRQLDSLCVLAAAAESRLGRPDELAATRDSVTGAQNAAFLGAYMTYALALARRHGENLSLLCIEPDHLAETRRRHGVEFADAALRRTVQAIVGTLRASDVVARLDESRLIAVLPGAGPEDARSVAEILRRAVGEAGRTAGVDGPLSASIGVACYPDHGREPGTLLAEATEALARAQADGEAQIATAQERGLSGDSAILQALRA